MPQPIDRRVRCRATPRAATTTSWPLLLFNRQRPEGDGTCFWRPMKVKGFGRRIFGIGWAAGGSRRTVELVSGEHGWSAMMFRHRFRLNLRSGLVGGVASVVVSG